MERRFPYNRKENKTMIEKTIYIAFDGEEFEDYNECERYERYRKFGKAEKIYG